MKLASKCIPLVIVFGLLGGCSATSSKSTEVTPDSSGAPGTTLASATVTEENLGVPFYPGATMKPGSDFKLELSTEKNYTIVLLTSDEPDKVKTFYESKVAGLKWNPLGTNGFMALTELPGKKRVAISISKKEPGSEIALSAGIH